MVYLDNAATTRCDSRAVQLIQETLLHEYGNPSSLHAMGAHAARLVREARARAAAALHCEERELIFTGGATEANNLAVLGGALARRRRGNRVVASAAEHSSVRGAVEHLQREGFDAVLIPPLADSRADPQAIAAAVDEGTVLVSCMLVNNETGAVNDVAALARAVKRKNPEVLLHCDAVQALGKVPLHLRKLGVDMASFSGHKIYGPKGVGALYVRRGVRVLPLLYGGGQEEGVRPGTENTAYIAAFGLCCALAQEQREARAAHAAQLRARLLDGVQKIEGVCINSPADGTPFIVNLSLPGIRSETMLHFLEAQGVYVSSGSACAKGAPSHVLTAMGLSRRVADSALRVSFSHEVRPEDVDYAVDCLAQGARTLVRTR